MAYRVIDASAFEGRRKLIGREVDPRVPRFNRRVAEPPA